MLVPKYRVRVDWAGDGSFSQKNSDVTADVLTGRTQRKLGADGICEGVLDLTLTDSWPGRYNAKNPGELANMLPNPSFETNLTGYTPDNATLARSNTWSAEGGWSMSVQASSATADCYCVTDAFETLPPNTQVAWSALVWSPVSALLDPGQCFLQEAGGGYRWIAAGGAGDAITIPANTPTVIRGTQATLSDWFGPTRLVLRPAGYPGAYDTAHPLYFDKLCVQYGSSASYIDGDMPDGRWAGAAHGSQTYSGAPLYGLIRPGRQCRVEISFDGGGTWHGLYGGFLNETESDPDYDAAQARINFSDLAYLDRPLPAIASTGPTTVDAALGLIHDAIGWTGSRAFNSDSPLSDFSADGSGTARDAIAALIKVDLGYYYVSRDFVATYVDRYEYTRRASSVTVESVGTSIPGVALSTIVNKATSTGPSGTPQSYEDSASVTEYGPLPDQSGDVQSDWFVDDGHAFGNAQWRVFTQKDPTSPYWQFQPMPTDDATLQASILVDVVDVVTTQPIGLPAVDQQALWTIHDFGGGQAHVVTWRLRDLPAIKPFLVGGPATVGDPAYVVVPG